MDGTKDDPMPNIDEMTDEELDRLGIDAALDWQQYCKYVHPGCSVYFFVNGCDCLDCSLTEIAKGYCWCEQKDREEE
jgi:hypothetical protein